MSKAYHEPASRHSLAPTTQRETGRHLLTRRKIILKPCIQNNICVLKQDFEVMEGLTASLPIILLKHDHPQAEGKPPARGE